MVLAIIIVAAAAAVFFLASLAVSHVFVEWVCHPKTHSRADSLSARRNDPLFDLPFYESLPKRDFQLVSSQGCRLSGRIVFQPGWEKAPRKKVVVLCHGWTGNIIGISNRIRIFYDKGYNCVAYDHRRHGDSGGDVCTMGLRESGDLVDICAYAREVFGGDCVLGIMGESMGAATVMMAAPLVERLDFAIEDCGYSSLRDELVHVGTRRYHAPKWPVTEFCQALFKRRYGFDITQVVPSESVARCEAVPMLFVHGDRDTLVPPWMMEACARNKKGLAMSRLFEGSEHGRSYADHPAEYKALVWEFLDRLGL